MCSGSGLSYPDMQILDQDEQVIQRSWRAQGGGRGHTWKVDHQRNLRTNACTAEESTGSVSSSAIVTIAQ